MRCYIFAAKTVYDQSRAFWDLLFSNLNRNPVVFFLITKYSTHPPTSQPSPDPAVFHTPFSFIDFPPHINPTLFYFSPLFFSPSHSQFSLSRSSNLFVVSFSSPSLLPLPFRCWRPSSDQQTPVEGAYNKGHPSALSSNVNTVVHMERSEALTFQQSFSDECVPAQHKRRRRQTKNILLTV